MGFVTFELTRALDEVLVEMVKRGYAKSKADAMRLALLEFGRGHGLTDAKFEWGTKHGLKKKSREDEKKSASSFRLLDRYKYIVEPPRGQ